MAILDNEKAIRCVYLRINYPLMKPMFEHIALPESCSINAFIQEKEEFDYPFHYHMEYELTYILSSRGIRYTGNHFEDFGDNDLVLVGPNLPHCWRNGENHNETASALVIQWKDDCLGEGWFNSKEFTAIRGLQQLAGKGVKFDEKVALAFKEKLVSIASLPPFEKLIIFLESLHGLAVSNGFKTICEQDYNYHLNRIDNERINTVYQFVKNNYRRKITLKEIAALVNMGEGSFSRFFSKTMNKGFFTFLNEYRINSACKLLAETDLQVVQVCYAAGYESLPFFYRQFRKFKNHSPQLYRDRFKQHVIS